MPPQSQQCQYCLPDSAYCIWRKVAEHCLPVLPPGSMISPSNKSGKADRSTEMGVTTAHTSLVKPWARVYGKQRANSSHPLCLSTDCLTGSFGSSLNFSLCFTHTMLDIESLSSGNALPVINRCTEESGLCPSGDPHSHICPCRLREGTQGEG